VGLVASLGQLPLNHPDIPMAVVVVIALSVYCETAWFTPPLPKKKAVAQLQPRYNERGMAPERRVHGVWGRFA